MGKYIASFLLLLTTSHLAQAAATIDAARVREIAAMLPAHASGSGPSNRMAWDALAAKPIFQRWLKTAEKELSTPFPEVSDDLFLDFSRTGNRSHWQEIEFSRRARLNSLALAECLENKG